MSLAPAEFAHFLMFQADKLREYPTSIREGRLKRVSGIVLEVEGLPMTIGAGAVILSQVNGKTYDAECIGFNGDITYLMPIDALEGISPGALVYPINTPIDLGDRYITTNAIEPLPIGEELLGRVVDGMGRPIDGKGNSSQQLARVVTRSMNPLDRSPIHEPLDTGVKAINGMLTVGRGQRVGRAVGLVFVRLRERVVVKLHRSKQPSESS